MTKHNWLSQKIIDRYGSKRGFMRTVMLHTLNLVTRRYSQYGKTPKHIERVVFVCKGNICRSAVAEHAFRKYSSLPTASIGLDTHTGKEGNSRIAQYADELDVDMREHRTTAVTDFNVEKGDLFVCMEPDHIKALEELDSSQNIVLLGYFGGPKKLYLHDPYSSTDAYAKRCTSYIVKAVENLANEIPLTSKESL